MEEKTEMFVVNNLYLYTASWRKRQKCSQLLIFIFIQHRGGKGRNVRNY